MTTYRYKYSCPDEGGTFEDAQTFNCDFSADSSSRFIAEAAAEHYHDDGGYAVSLWPLVMELWTMEGRPLGRFSVERETGPQFHATTVT